MIKHLSTSFSPKRLLIWGALLFLSGWNLINTPAIYSTLFPMHDFIEYWSAAKAFVEGDNPYSPQVLQQIQKEIGRTASDPIMMWNPPWILPLLVPFALLPFWIAHAAWHLMSIILTLLAADWFWRLYGGANKYRWASWLAVLLFLPSLHALYLGQVSPIIFVGLWGFLVALLNKRLLPAGLFAVLITLKPQLLYIFWIFLALWTLKHRAWKLLWSVGGGLLFLCLIVEIINSNTLIDYLVSLTSAQNPLIWDPPTLGGILKRLFPQSGWLIRFTPSFLGVVVAFWLWYRWERAFDWKKRLPTILFISVITCSFCWHFDWVVLLPVINLLLIWFLAQPAIRWWIPLFLVCTQALLVVVGSGSSFNTVWLPPILWLLYSITTLISHQTNPSIETP